MYVPIIFGVLYLSSKNLVFWLYKYSRNRMLMSKRRKPNQKNQLQKKTFVDNYKEKFSKYKSFVNTQKELKYKFWGLTAIGLVIILILSYFELYYVAALLLFAPFAIDAYMFSSLKEPVEKRERILAKMLELKISNMGQSADKGSKPSTQTEMEIIEWSKDNVTPKKVRLFIPTSFDNIREEAFLTQWNLHLGGETPWAPDVEDKDYPGWRYNDGIVTLKAGDPLPSRADWSEAWLLNDRCAWSFFPLALGVEGGVMMVDPATGKEVHVLGMDLAGEQIKLGAKGGFYVDQSLTTSPQALVVGATGGGKSLSLQTEIPYKN